MVFSPETRLSSLSLSQTCIVTHESNGIDIITALILNDISPLCRYRMEMVLQLKVHGHSPGGGSELSRRSLFLFISLSENE